MWAWFCVALAATWIGTALARRYALRRNLLDQPGERRNHVVATPRGGGIAMVLVMLMLLVALAAPHASDAVSLLLAALSIALVGGVGWWDDHHPLPVVVRLAVHLLAAACIGLAGWSAGWGVSTSLLGMALAAILINFWNFMDGIDGLAASQAMLVALCGAMFLTGAWQGVCLVLAGASLGFLAWNFPKARIFMGDVGSGVLGLALAWLWTRAAAENIVQAWLLLFALAPFLVDAGMTLLRRIWRRERWWEAHSTHTYQLLARRWGSHVLVTMGYAGLTSLGCLVALALRDVIISFILAALAAWYIALVIMWWMSRTSATDKAAHRSRE